MRDADGYPLPMEIGQWQGMVEAAPVLGAHGSWVCLNLVPDIPWPVRPQSTEFAGHEVWIISLTQGRHPGVALKRTPDMSIQDAERILNRFLSVLSWRENTGLAVAFRTGGNFLQTVQLERERGFAIRDEFDFTEISCPAEESARIALALMREARSLKHHGYAFLSYWRVLELAFPNANARVAWMSKTIPILSGRGVPEALQELAAGGVEDIGRHLFTSGRCAIAHATGRPIIDPDEPEDARRLERELPLVRELAIQVIDDQFGIESPSTEWSRHLFELRGWKAVFGDELIAATLAGQVPDPDQVVDLPRINIRLRGTTPYPPFENMVPVSADLDGQEICLVYVSGDGLTEFRFRLAPAEERLRFDVFEGIFGHDDGSLRAAEHRRDSRRFFRDYALNGELQMWNAENGALLSRVGPFMPLNMMVDLDACNANIAAAQAIVDARLTIEGNQPA